MRSATMCNGIGTVEVAISRLDHGENAELDHARRPGALYV